ncbi:MAG TPA: hypothetical protein EYH40_06420 [Desulfurococcales archaeon]|nr:hypothetical protein [Desulfurococcales archaeon]
MLSNLIRQLYVKSKRIIEDHGLMGEYVRVYVRGAREVIGVPSISEYAILKGREVMIEAVFNGYRGQAFTSSPGQFSGALRDVFKLDLQDLKNRSIFIAVLNAVMAYLGFTDRTVHCKSDFPDTCSKMLVSYLKELNVERVGLIGYQPSMLKSLSESKFNVRVADANPDNIGKVKFGVSIEPPNLDEEIICWSDIALVTGSVFVNGSLDEILPKYKNKIIIYGVSGAAASKILGFRRWCISNERVYLG